MIAAVLTDEQRSLLYDIADHIERNVGAYDQDDWGSVVLVHDWETAKQMADCGTPACLAGHALIVLHRRGQEPPEGMRDVHSRIWWVARQLGLPDTEADMPDMFERRPSPWEKSGREVTAESMVAHLRAVAKRGEWRHEYAD